MDAPAVTRTPEPTPSASTNDRGNIVKIIGQPAMSLTRDREEAVRFRVDWISENPKCDYPDYPKPPEGKKRIALHLTVETTPALAENEFGGYLSFDPILWKYINSDGTTYGGDLGVASGILCETKEGPLPDTFGPAEKGAGTIVMEVPALDGTLIYNSPNGWEYDLAAALKQSD